MVSRAMILCTPAAVLALGLVEVRAAGAEEPSEAPIVVTPASPAMPAGPAPASEAAVTTGMPAEPASPDALLAAGDESAPEEAPDRSDVDELSFALGAATFLLTSAVGGTMFGRAGGPAIRNAGSSIMQYGFAVAPFVAHLPAGEYARGLAFSATPLAMGIANSVLLGTDPIAIDEQGTPATRVPYAAFFTLGMVSSVVGIVDAAFASKRHTRLPVALVPAASPHGASLNLGGTF